MTELIILNNKESINPENIKNIIFDLGNVLISFNPKDYTDNEKFLKEVFGSPEWLMLDRGTLSYGEAKEIFKERVPEVAEQIDSMFDSSFSGLLQPIKENTALLPILKEKYNLYILSNFHKDSFEEVYKSYEFFKNFKGKVVSCYCHLLKPEKEIYEEILNKFSLNPEETVFIDDMKVNIEAAEKLGIKGIHLPDYTKLKEKLEGFLK
ncbi:MAG: HAD family phosphatase [Leptotrichiaceae bacterium]|nr:HAD family phosphatase [Leptotrichiaceae bacterium]